MSSTANRSAEHRLQEPPARRLAKRVQYFPGVGGKRAQFLARLGLRTASDVLFFFPRDYQDLSDLRAISDLEEDKLQSVCGTVEETELRSTGIGRSILGVLVRQDNDFMRAIWFNQPYMRDKFVVGQQVLLSGQPRMRGGRWEMTHPRVRPVDEAGDELRKKLVPVYPLTEGIAQYQLRRLASHAIELCLDCVDDVFPESLREAYQLLPIDRAVAQIHFPSNQQQLDAARRRLVFQELFVLQLALAVRRRQQHDQARAAELPATDVIDQRIRRLFPFSLTSAQQQAIGEIAADMSRPWPMNRLLHGDVGSGKTVPAAYAMLLCVAHGYQAVLMAPTEVLARQHAETFAEYLKAARVRRALLTGGLGQQERRDTLRKIAAGDVDLVIGTQAIVQDDVRLAKPGLVVIDEQHKFGVRQRAVLKQAGLDPHYLVMSATPIPRSVSMTLFGDLDLSTLNESPPGRQPVQTQLVGRDQLDAWWEFVRAKLREGRQAFVITPLVEESQRMETDSAEEVFEALSNGQLEPFRLGLIHGRMTSVEKRAAMEAFHSGKTQVLVSTSVVEVGVNVPNATVVTILSAERFGLAQLHQLRGRITRGQLPGYCGVVADIETEDARKRLDAFVKTADGFELAEIDFQLRGPGELFGTKQHGLPPLRIADLRRDMQLLREARRKALELVASDPALSQPPHNRLRRMVLARYGKELNLGDVG